MGHVTTFTLGALARIVSVLAARYADWLMHKIMEGIENFDFVRDLKRFCHWLLRCLAEQFSSRRHWLGHEDEDWQEPAFFGAR